MQHSADSSAQDIQLVAVWLDSKTPLSLYPSTGGIGTESERLLKAAPLTDCTESADDIDQMVVGVCYLTSGRGTVCNSSHGEVSVEAVVIQGPAQLPVEAIHGGDASAIGEALYLYCKSGKWNLCTHSYANAGNLQQKVKIGLIMNTHSNLHLLDVLI